MSLLPMEILPEVQSLGRLNEDGTITIDHQWWLLLYNIVKNSVQSGISPTGDPVAMVDNDAVDIDATVNRQTIAEALQIGGIGSGDCCVSRDAQNIAQALMLAQDYLLPESFVGGTGATGATGATGPAGAPVVSAVAAVNLLAGQPVYSDQVSGQFKLANASALTTSSVIGLIVADTLATFIAGADQLSLMLTDWTAVIGVASLTKGAVYFLSTTAGMLTTTPPTIVGQTVVRIGVALTTQLMSLAIQEPILL